MPSSDEMFGGAASGAMLPGEQRDLPPSMFNFGGGFDGDRRSPTPEELERDYERALHTKATRLKSVNIKTFDLSKDDERDEYCKLCVNIYNTSISGTIVVQQHERKFVESEPKPRWIVHIEWWEYVLMVDGKELTPQEYEAWRKLERAKEQQAREKEPTDGA